jgi:glutaminyl-tRNA synthetase
VRLRYGYFIKCEEVVKNDAGDVVRLRCSYDPATRGGSAPDGRKVKGTIHWVSAEHAVPVQVRLYDRLFNVANPDEAAAKSGADFTEFINPDSRVMLADARLEPAVADAAAGSWFQFERQGYFFTDPEDSEPGVPIFNRVVTLRDTWAKIAAEAEAEAAVAAGEATGDLPADRAAGEEDAAAGRRRSKRSGADLRARARSRNPELAARYTRYQDALGLGEDDADLLTGDASVAELFEAALEVHDDPREVANWVINDVSAYFNDGRADRLRFGGPELGVLVGLVDAGTISRTAGKEVLGVMAEEGGDPAVIVEARGLQQVTDSDAIESVVDEVLAAHPDKVAEYRGGREGLAGFFIGQVMRETGGTAAPEIVDEIVRAKLDD